MPKKQFNKGPRKPKAAPVAPDAPVFHYTSVCCTAKATKPPLVKTPEREGTLGTWRCTGCGKACKCAQSKAKGEIQNMKVDCIEREVAQ